MPRNGSGTYALVSGNPVTTGTVISSTWANNTLSDIATALTASLAKDGQTSPAIAGATATTQAATDSSTKVATTAFVRQFRQLAQSVTYTTGAVATGTTVIPLDDTIPQNTEGDQYMSLAITPTNASSTLEITVNWYGANDTLNSYLMMALFQDSTTNALASAFIGNTQLANGISNGSLVHSMTAGTTSATTFKVRAGANGGTTTFNGRNAGRIFGGNMASRITINEYLPCYCAFLMCRPVGEARLIRRLRL